MNTNNNNKNNAFSVRCLKNSSAELSSSVLFLELYKAYLEARRHKRNTYNQLKFEVNLESALQSLCSDLLSRKYVLSPSICFINEEPVKREIIAADFRDRVVHHLLWNWISPIFERQFIYDSYSCRKNKGTLFGIQRASGFLRAASDDLPCDKSLKYTKPNCGLPIGNLTSQLFGNVYLNSLDHFIKRDLKAKYYGRYVDDMVLVHSDKYFLLNTIPKIRVFLKENLGLVLHPKKISLQPASRGFPFLGAYVLPYRTYLGRRFWSNYRKCLDFPDPDPVRQNAREVSYEGLAKHFSGAFFI